MSDINFVQEVPFARVQFEPVMRRLYAMDNTSHGDPALLQHWNEWDAESRDEYRTTVANVITALSKEGYSVVQREIFSEIARLRSALNGYGFAVCKEHGNGPHYQGFCFACIEVSEQQMRNGNTTPAGEFFARLRAEFAARRDALPVKQVNE